jgi:hypothetical protein
MSNSNAAALPMVKFERRNLWEIFDALEKAPQARTGEDTRRKLTAVARLECVETPCDCSEGSDTIGTPDRQTVVNLTLAA